MKNYYKVTKEGKQYVSTRAKTMRGIVNAFEASPGGNVYELELPNGRNQQYLGNELTYEQRINILIADGFVKQV